MRDAHNWLAAEMAEAPSDYAMAFTRDAWNGRHEMLAGDDAARFRDKLAERYRDWTGRDLARDLSQTTPTTEDKGREDRA